MHKSKVISIFVILLLLIPIVFFATSVQAAPTVTDTQKQTNTILNNVLGINSNQYSTQINSQEDTQKSGLPQNTIDYRLTSDYGSVRVRTTFINNKLNLLYLTDYSGVLETSKISSDTGKSAKSFLESYQKCASDSFFGTLAQTLNDINGEKNVTKSVGNITLEVQNSGKAVVDYVWTYTDANGITAYPKNVVLSYYQGQLNCFLDNWHLYDVVGTPKISKEQAIEIALASVQNYSYQVDNSTVSLSDFKVAPESLKLTTLSYANFPNASLARDNDQFKLYPSWWVPLGFDKFYPGDVSGIAVTVWADTGKVSSTELMITDSSFANANQAATLDDNKLNQSVMTLAPSIIIIAIVCIGTMLATKTKFVKFSVFKKTLVMLFCSVIVLSAMTSAVNANSVIPNSSARIYASLDGDPNYGPPDWNGSPPQTTAERDAAYWVQTQLDSSFAASNYIVYKDVEDNTTFSKIYDNILDDQSSYDELTVFQYGHLYDKGVGYVDNNGLPVMEDSIDDYVTTNKYKLVLLWVCCQSEYGGQVVITPICDAWMGDDVTSTDGYIDPDNSGKCFISFFGFSPWIGNNVRTFQQLITPAMKCFIADFYNLALVYGYNVSDALNIASMYNTYHTYTTSILHTGYDTWWPGTPVAIPGIEELQPAGWYPSFYYGDDYPKNSIQLFGDGRLRLTQPELTLSTNSGLSPTFYVDGSPCSPGVVNLWQRPYSVSVSVPAGKVLYNWVLDNNQNLGNALSVDVTMDGDHTLYANFIDAPSPLYPYAYSIQSYTDIQYITSQQRSLTGYQPDGYFAGIQGISVYETYGQITAAMNTPATGHVWVYGAGAGPLWVYVSSTGSSWTPVGSYTFTSSTPQWVDLGIAWSSFSYISLSAGGDASFGIDSIQVRPIVNYTLTVNSATGGTTNPSAGAHTYTETSSVNVQATPSSGYYLDHWLLNGTDVGSSNPYTVTMNNNYILQPVFYQYTLTIYPTSYGTTTPAPGNYTYSYGQTQTVTANPNTGYRLDHWVLDGSNAGSSSTIDVTMNRAHTLQAIYSPLTTYTISVATWCVEGFSVPATVYVDGVPYSAGTPITVYAGYHTIAADDVAYFIFYLAGFSDGLGNGDTRYINSNTQITAYYVRY